MGRQGARPVKVLEDGICGSLCPLPLGPRISPRRLWIGPSIGAVRSRLEVGTNLANDFSGCAEWCGSDPCSPSSVLKVIEAEDRQAAKLSDHLGKFLGQKGRDRPRGVDSGYRRSLVRPACSRRPRADFIPYPSLMRARKFSPILSRKPVVESQRWSAPTRSARSLVM
jgi:hypothetical protein